MLKIGSGLVWLLPHPGPPLGSGYKDKKDDQKGCFNCKKPDHFIAYCSKLQKDKSKKERSKNESFRNKVSKSLMSTCEMLDEETDEEEAIWH
jgi:hypothetical protein